MHTYSLPLSVILSTYNQPAWLEKALWGYSVQEFTDFEIVVADDGSGSDTKACIERMRSQTGMVIQHVWHEDDGFRKCEILNHAINCASGEYLVFSDGDCIPRRDFLAVHYANRSRGHFLSGGAVRLPLGLSQAITPADIVAGAPFSISWLRRHSQSQGLPRLTRLVRVACTGQTSKLLDRLTTTRPTWNGNNASGWKSDVVAVNGMDERMAYGGEDCELGERLVNAGLTPKQLRFSAALVHLDHGRGYVREAAIRINKEIRHNTRSTGSTWTNFGLLGTDSSTGRAFTFNDRARQSTGQASPPVAPRLFISDSEITRPGGHNVELASVIADAAKRVGFHPVIITHRTFQSQNDFDDSFPIRPIYRFSLMRKWSLCIDGNSRDRRDERGRIAAIDTMKSAFRHVRESIKKHSPLSAINEWSDDFAHWFREFQPTSKDRIFLSTACDFTLLGLVSAMRKVSASAPLRIDLLFHLALLPGREGESHSRQHELDAFKHQIESSLNSLTPHDIRLLATTEELARQFNQAVGRELWSAIDYPIRNPASAANLQTPERRSRILLAGSIRREKGRYDLSTLIDQLWTNYLSSGQWQLAFQLPKKRWRRLLPKFLWSRADAFRSNQNGELFLNQQVLDADAYQAWIQSATIGVFLYDPRRYYARCSGVLLEMLIAGIPVIVPAGSWLSHQLQMAANEHTDRLWDTALKQPLCPHKVIGDEQEQVLRLEFTTETSAVLISFPNILQTGDTILMAVRFDCRSSDDKRPDAKYSFEQRDDCGPRGVIAVPATARKMTICYRLLTNPDTYLAPPEVVAVHDASVPFPESAVGLIATDIDQIPRLLDEFHRHKLRYQQSAMAYASTYAEKHSPDRFVETLLLNGRSWQQKAA